jgi:hypothetical protein
LRYKLVCEYLHQCQDCPATTSTFEVEVVKTDNYLEYWEDGGVSYLHGWKTPGGNWYWYARAFTQGGDPVLVDAMGQLGEDPAGGVLTANGGPCLQTPPPDPNSTITVEAVV